MTLLSLTNEELVQQIEAELSKNPALELSEERHCPNCHRLLSGTVCPICSQPNNNPPEEPIVFVSSRDDYSYGDYIPSEDTPEDNYSCNIDDLPTFVLKQIAPELNPHDRLVAAYILTNLDEDGFLTISPLEVANYHHISLNKVKEILTQIQRCEPLGVGSSCPQEALLAQLSFLAETMPIPDLARLAIEKGMDFLSRHQYHELGRALGVSSSLAKEIAAFITDNLNPYPARTHWGDPHQKSSDEGVTYRRPDIIISYLNDNPKNNLVVEIILPLRGTLRVNPMFRQAVHDADDQKKSEWKEDLDRASLLVKCLQQRNHTMKRLMNQVVRFQQDFILHGETHLKPLTRVELSIRLDVHESTISRAVSEKTVQLPNRRIIPLSRFFSRNLNARTILKNIIEKEIQPLNDTELMKLLAKEGILISRRTVAKYRAMEGILPAHLRHPITAVPL